MKSKLGLIDFNKLGFNKLGICCDCKKKLATHAKGKYTFLYRVENIKSKKAIRTQGKLYANLCCDCFKKFLEAE